MAKKTNSDTVTFKKDELVKKIKNFLDVHGACDGDWLNKARVEFLGQQEQTVTVEVMIPATLEITLATDGTPTKEEVASHIREQMDAGEFCGFEVDDCDQEFEVKKVTKL